MVRSEIFEINYTLTRHDYSVAMSAIMRLRISRSLYILALELFSLWCVMYLVMDTYDPSEIISRISANSVHAIFFVSLVIALVIITLGNRWVVRAIAYLHYPKLAAANVTTTMTMTDAGIQSRSSVATSMIPWHSVKRVICESEYLIAMISSQEALIFPKRSFKSDERFSAAVRYATEKLLS